MLAASLRREVHLSNVLVSRMQSRVPRCLFGAPDHKETAEMLNDALDNERSKFTSRWGIDPCSEDKENFQRKHERIEAIHRSPRRNRTPYSRQTTISDYWRSRKNSDTSKKGIGLLDSPKKPLQDCQKIPSSPKSSKSLK